MINVNNHDTKNCHSCLELKCKQRQKVNFVKDWAEFIPVKIVTKVPNRHMKQREWL